MAFALDAGTTTPGRGRQSLTGGLAFAPAEVTVAAGDTVRWRNTDFLVPHTVGKVLVAPTLATRSRRVTRRRRGRRMRVTIRYVDVRWAAAAPGEDLAFDVERRIAGGDWTPLANRTTEQRASFTVTVD